MSKSIEKFIQQMQEITARTESNIIAKISVVDEKVELASTRIDSLSEKVTADNSAIMQRLAVLEEHVLQPTQKCEAPKSVNTVQYNNAAQKVQPIGKCKVWYKNTWQEVDFFGFCATCGDPILSPSVVGYCTVNNKTLECYPCQHGGKRTAKYKEIVLSTGTVRPEPTHTPVDKSIIVKCDICGKPRKYKSSDDYLAKKQYAESLGLPGVMCVECARKAMDNMNKEESTPTYVDPIAYEREIREDKRQARIEALNEKMVVPYTEGAVPMDEMVQALLLNGHDAESVKALKIADVRAYAISGGREIAFDGREWNKNKVSVVDAVEEAILAKGKETDEMMHPQSPMQQAREVVDVIFEEDTNGEVINQGF